MAIMLVAQTLDVHGDEMMVLYYIRHELDGELSFRVSVDPIAIDYCTSTIRNDFSNDCLTVIFVAYETQVGVRITMTWT